MVLKSDKEKVKTLLSETIRLLCKNGLHFKTEFSVEALVGITLDREEEFFLSIKEIVKTDIPPPKPKPDVVRTPKEIRRSSVKEVKGEPKEMSPCPRKRPAETVTNNGSASDLPNLSLGDMQESEPTFWGSVTERDDGGGQVVKKKRTDPNDDDSNSNVITIKGEPGSDSDNDIECVGDSSDRDNTLDQSTMGDMSGSFMYGTPTSEQSMLGNMTTNMGQSWDQMPQFPMPGPSGMAQGGDVSQDSQQQQEDKPKKLFMCGLCPAVYNIKFSLKRHTLIKHSDEGPKCGTCGKKFAGVGTLEKHIAQVHRGEIHRCHLCQKVYRTQAGLKSHINDHEGKYRFWCEICKTGFQYKTTYKDHISKHQGIKGFKCPRCQKRMNFASRAPHMQVCGVEEKKFQCDICSAKFTTERYMKAHVEFIHCDEPKFQCQQCGKRFRVRGSLHTHVRIKHEARKKK